ncbi:hypothetical protein BSKO_14142 [Bryopsis sp. KO-2023]|nr:hypothetical protein BSKO_14142 [Bryopsis sp. KO-2023]
MSSLESERDELSHRCECLVTSEIKTAGREAAKESKEAAEELDSKAEALSEQLANISIACARDRSDSLMDRFKCEIRAKAEMIDELMDDSSAISESFASECMEGPKNGLPNMERIVNLWRSTCDARQLREISSVKEIMEANDLRVELVVARRAIDSKDAELSDGLDRLLDEVQSQAKATKEQMQEFEDALQFTADDDKILKLMLNEYGDSRRIDCKCLMEVCEKQSRDAHRYQEKCCTLEKDLDEESEITKLSEEMDSFSRRSEELGALQNVRKRFVSSAWVELEIFIVSDSVTRSKLTATVMADTEKEKGTETGSLGITGVDFVKNTNLNRSTSIYDSTEFLAVTRFAFSRNVQGVHATASSCENVPSSLGKGASSGAGRPSQI